MNPSPTPTQQERLPFDAEICEALADRCREIFLRHPEVKAVGASIVWNGKLNDADINHHIWISPHGAVTTPDGIIASVYQTLKLLDQQMGRALQLAEQMRDTITTLGEEATKKHGELQGLQAQIEGLKAEVAQRGHAPAGGT